MKIHVKQVPPEYQESPLLSCPEFFPDNVAVFGNRHYNEHTFPEFDAVRSAFDDNEPPAGYEDSAQWAVLLDEYRWNDTGRDCEWYCKGLALLTGRKWDCCMIHGCCQGDWQYMIYAVDDWSRDALTAFEVEYFNDGTEWETPDGHVYCTSWNNDGIKVEIAHALGYAPADVVLHKFTGWTKTPNYETEESN